MMRQTEPERLIGFSGEATEEKCEITMNKSEEEEKRKQIDSDVQTIRTLIYTRQHSKLALEVSISEYLRCSE